MSEFSRQLSQKQKIRFLYGLSEHQFARMVKKALKRHGENLENTISRFLETRLDNVIFRLGFAASPSMARMLINHGHVRVDGRKVTSSSFLVRPGYTITIAPSVSLPSAGEEKFFVPSWLSRLDDTQSPIESRGRSGKIEAWPDASQEDRLRFPDTRGIIDYYAR